MSHHYSALTDFSLKLLYIHVKMHFEEFFFNLLTYIYIPTSLQTFFFPYDLYDFVFI